MEKLNINQWAEEDRPREKMMALGAQALSDAELLAILVGSGSPQEDAVSLMKRILNDCNNNLNTLGKMTLRQLCEYNGVGPAKAITILAACELGKRYQDLQPHAPCSAGLRRRRVLASADESEPSTYQTDTHFAWWHHRGFC